MAQAASTASSRTNSFGIKRSGTKLFLTLQHFQQPTGGVTACIHYGIKDSELNLQVPCTSVTWVAMPPSLGS